MAQRDSQRLPRSYELPAGTAVGHYEIEELIDEGGMAVVYRAHNKSTGRVVALKVLHAQLGNHPEFQQLFAKEAKVGSVVGDNPAIVHVYDAGLDEALGIPFIVMELLEGETLERALQRGPMKHDVIAVLMRQLQGALLQAHRAGVVHRDLKPSNLFLVDSEDEYPRLKVMDFGIAKVLEGEALRTATQLGTPAYTAPEQMGSTTRKLAAKQGITIAKGVSPATDVWPIGLIALEMFTARMPSQYWGVSTLAELPMKIAFEPSEAASSRAGEAASLLPEGFDDWFARCLHKNAAERFDDAGDAIDELCAMLPEVVVETAPHSMRVTPPPLPNADAVADPADIVEVPAAGARSIAKTAPGDFGESPSTVAAMPLPPASSKALSVDPPVKADGKKSGKSTGGKKHKSGKSTGGKKHKSGKSTGGKKHKSGLTSAARQPGSARFGLGLAAVAAVAAAAWLAGPRKALQGVECKEATPSDPSSCVTSCAAGSLDDCAKLGTLFSKSDPKRAHAALAKACGVPETLSTKTDALKRIEKKGCAEGKCVPQACVDLAAQYETGSGVDKNARVATALYQRTCDPTVADGGNVRTTAGCVGIGDQRRKAGQVEAAVSYYKTACDAGAIAGCTAFGKVLEHGAGATLARDEKRARGLYERACNNGDMKACTALGSMVERGRGGWVANGKEAVQLYRRACDGDDLGGCGALARAYERGSGGLPRDSVRAAELHSQACDQGGADACASLAEMTREGRGGLSRDAKKAYELNKKSCDDGSALGCAQLGGMVARGDAGLTKSPTEARSLWMKSCKGGEPSGCLELAKLDDGPHGEVRGALKRGCDGGDGRACVGLGEILQEGLGGERDIDSAAKLFTRGCDDGDARACTHLANLTYQGLGGLEKSAAKSVALNDKSCRFGDPVGCARLGVLYALGQGVDRDRSRAQQLFEGACSNGMDVGEMQSRCAMLKQLIDKGAQSDG